MENVIQKMTQKGWAIWALVKVGEAPIVFFTNKTCKYIGIMVEKSIEKSLVDSGYVFSKNEKRIQILFDKAKLFSIDGKF